MPPVRVSAAAHTKNTAHANPGMGGACMMANQFFSACIGAGMRPPRWIMTAGLNLLMGMMGA